MNKDSVLKVLGVAWSVLAVIGVLVYGFLNQPTWATFSPMDNHVTFNDFVRFVILAAFYVGGIISACYWISEG